MIVDCRERLKRSLVLRKRLSAGDRFRDTGFRNPARSRLSGMFAVIRVTANIATYGLL